MRDFLALGKRRALLCRDREKTERTLVRAHGLSRLGWKELLADGVGKVPDLKIQAQKEDTFREVIDVAWHEYLSSIFRGNPENRDIFPELHDLGKARLAGDQSSLTLCALRARSRYTGTRYQAVTGEPSRLHSATVRFDKGGRIQMCEAN